MTHFIKNQKQNHGKSSSFTSINCTVRYLRLSQLVWTSFMVGIEYSEPFLYYTLIQLFYITLIDMLEKAVEILKEFEAQNGATLTQKSLGIVEKRPGTEQIGLIQRRGGVQGVLPSDFPEQKLQKINEKAEEKEIYLDLDIPIKLGEPFKNYGEIDNVMDEGKTVLAHKPGEVLLVDVWATWCGPCQGPMKHNQEMLEKHKETWKDRVRIVGVSVDDSKETVKQRVEAKKWQDVIHLTLLGWKGEHPLISDFKVQGIPFVCLVDKFGKTNYVGHPMGINLENRIKELLEKETEDEPAAPAAPLPAKESSFTQEQVQKLTLSFSKENLEKDIKDFDFLCFKYTITRKYANNDFSSKIEINASVMEEVDEQGAQENEAAVQNRIKQAQEYFQQFKGVELNIERAKYLTVHYEEHPKCWKCNSALAFPYYWLKWQEGNKFGCRQCVEAKSTQEGHHYAYEKNSVLLLGKWDKVAVKNLGQNIQPADVTKVQDGHGYGCNCCGGCSGEIGEARFICLGCRADPNPKGDYVDVCVPCMEKVINGDGLTLQALKSENHVTSHPWLRVLYNTSGYYQF